MRKQNGVINVISALVAANAVCVVFLCGLFIYITWGGVLKARKVETTPHPEPPPAAETAEPSWFLPEGYVTEIIDIDGLIMEYTHIEGDMPEKAILQLHGGAYTRNLDAAGIYYRRTAARYAEISGAGVLTVDYRVAPDDPYPAALEDALTAYAWLMEKGFEPLDIIIAGDSAGGGLALATVLYLRDNGYSMPAAVITMSAWTNLDYAVITPPYVGDSDPTEPYISPVYGDYSGFPPMLMQAGGGDELLEDTLAVAQKAADDGVNVTLTVYPGMVHVFQLFFELSETDEAWMEATEFISDIFQINK